MGADGTDTGVSLFEGGVPDSWTAVAETPVSSASTPSTGVGRSWTGSRIGGGRLFRGRRHALLVVLRPFHDLDEDRPQAPGVGGDLVLHPGRHLGEDRPL